MCGRYVRRTPLHQVVELFSAIIPSPGLDLAPSYNIAPSQNVLAIRQSGQGSREVCILRWGLVPPWADDPAIGNRMINARAESAADKPAFRSAFARQRCILPADGFYEWQRTPEGKQPWLIARTDQRPVGLAGLWERWSRGDQTIESCTILTTDANDLIRSIHNRMPAILPEADFDAWLDPQSPPRKLKALLRPLPPGELAMHRVSNQVNAPRNDDASLIQPLARAPQ